MMPVGQLCWGDGQRGAVNPSFKHLLLRGCPAVFEQFESQLLVLQRAKDKRKCWPWQKKKIIEKILTKSLLHVSLHMYYILMLVPGHDKGPDSDTCRVVRSSSLYLYKSFILLWYVMLSTLQTKQYCIWQYMDRTKEKKHFDQRRHLFPFLATSVSVGLGFNSNSWDAHKQIIFPPPRVTCHWCLSLKRGK